jgi:hypothetical protein
VTDEAPYRSAPNEALKMDPAHARTIAQVAAVRAEPDEQGYQRLLTNYPITERWEPVNITGTAPVQNYNALTLTSSRGTR